MQEWIIYALLAGALYAFMSLIMIKISEKYNEFLVLFYVFLFATIYYLLTIKIQKYNLQLNKNDLLLLFVAAFLSFLANLVSLKAAVKAPNPAYASMISRFSNVLLLTFLSVLLLHRELNFVKIIGIIIMLIGSVILCL